MSDFDYECGPAAKASGLASVNNPSVYGRSFWDDYSVTDHNRGSKACEKSISGLVKIGTQGFRQTHCQVSAVGHGDLLRLAERSFHR
jgi:hypothetical protein